MKKHILFLFTIIFWGSEVFARDKQAVKHGIGKSQSKKQHKKSKHETTNEESEKNQILEDFMKELEKKSASEQNKWINQLNKSMSEKITEREQGLIVYQNQLLFQSGMEVGAQKAIAKINSAKEELNLMFQGLRAFSPVVLSIIERCMQQQYKKPTDPDFSLIDDETCEQYLRAHASLAKLGAKSLLTPENLSALEKGDFQEISENISNNMRNQQATLKGLEQMKKNKSSNTDDVETE